MGFAAAIGLIGLLGATVPTGSSKSLERVSRYNVVWNSPSKEASGVMPIGNGDIGAGVYAIENGDLYLLLSKNDAFNYSGEIYKTGKVRITMEPNPFKSGTPFRQTLDLSTGSIFIEAGGIRIRVWADANRSTYHVEIDAPSGVSVSARPELWKRLDGTRDVRSDGKNNILWYFPVGDRSVYPDDLKFYQVEEMAAKHADPYRYNTFGNLLECPSLALREDALRGKANTFDIRIHSLREQTPDASGWVDTIRKQAAASVDLQKAWKQHCNWWAKFWDKSWIVAADNTVPRKSREKFMGEPTSAGTRSEDDAAALVSQSYNVFRFLMACQSRGRNQVKFNGGIFTQQLLVESGDGRPAAAKLENGKWLTHEDDRLWGRRYTYQNQRHLYWPLLASGDFDLMQPFFNYYFDLLDMRKAITKSWFGHDGAYYRENIEPDGAERDCDNGGKPPRTRPGEKYEGWYHDYYFTCGLETTAMMIDYANFTGDSTFRDKKLVPFAREILSFFDHHYPRVNGKLRLEPAQVVETWWIAVNPAPDVAGLRFCLDGLLEMKAGTPDDQLNWRRFRAEIPEIPTHMIGGELAIAPADQYEKKRNAENGELYPVFPFRCFGVGLGTADIVRSTMKNRTFADAMGSGCWTQDQIDWAFAGNAAEASEGLARRFRTASSMCRFPLYGKEGPDSCPDFDHFGAGSTAFQRMLVQEAGGKIHLLPAWPADWNVDFKLHIAAGGVVTGTVKDGKLTAWDIQPPERKRDVVIYPPQVGGSAGSAIPDNVHPLHAGSDSNGGSHFLGKIGRVTLFRERITASRVRELASSDRTRRVSGKDVVGSWLNPRAGDQLATKPEDYNGPVSFEVWIQPGENESGRILDKITAGIDDGMLLDAWPKLSLRLIVGSQTRNIAGVLKPGVWQHIALVITRGSSAVYLDGQKLL